MLKFDGSNIGEKEETFRRNLCIYKRRDNKKRTFREQIKRYNILIMKAFSSSNRADSKMVMLLKTLKLLASVDLQ